MKKTSSPYNNWPTVAKKLKQIGLAKITFTSTTIACPINGQEFELLLVTFKSQFNSNNVTLKLKKRDGRKISVGFKVVQITEKFSGIWTFSFYHDEFSGGGNFTGTIDFN